MTNSASVLLDPDQVDELRRLLGTVEDWLLHAGDETLDDLGGFLAGLSWSSTTPGAADRRTDRRPRRAHRPAWSSPGPPYPGAHAS